MAQLPMILVVDDDRMVADTLAEVLTRGGYTAVAVYDGETALECALVTSPSVLIADILLSGISGIDLAAAISRIFPNCQVILSSGEPRGYGLLGEAREANELVVSRFEFLPKPVSPSTVLACVARKIREDASIHCVRE